MGCYLLGTITICQSSYYTVDVFHLSGTILGTMATSIASAKCTSCSKWFKDPRMLPCLHTFCLQCIERISQQGAPKCPTCSEEIKLPEGGIEKLPFDLRKAHEALYDKKLDGGNKACDVCVRTEDAVRAFCVNCCEFLCDSCESHHRSARKTQKHEVVQVNKAKKGERSKRAFFAAPLPCTIHSDEALKYYCEKCEEIICRDCMDFSHNEHRSECNRVEAIATRAMKSLKACTKSSPSDAVVKDTISKCEEAIGRIDLRKEEVDKTVRTRLELCDVLLARSDKRECLQVQIKQLQKVGSDLECALNMISQAELHTPPEQLATKKVITERVENLKKQYHNIYLECVHIIKKADADVNDVIGRRIILCQIAAYCTCDVGFVPRAIVGKERTMKVSTRNKENDIFLHGKKIVTAKLSLTESNELCIYGTSTDHGDGTFSVSFTAQSIGVHNLEVEIGGQPIKVVPFR